MKITRLESFSTQDVGFVRATCEDGSQGWGQFSPYNADITATVFHRQVARWAVGENAFAIDELIATIGEREHKFPGSYLCRAMTGLDTALWDLRGRIERKSVCELLGGTPRPVPVYASSMKRGEIKPEAEAERFLRLRDAHGYCAFKFRVGRECGHDIDEWPGRTEAIVPQIRRALGTDATLLVDGNSAYSPAKAIAVGRMLQDHGIVHFEEPCPYWEHAWTREVRETLDLDVTGGEQDCDLAVWRAMIDGRVVDVVQPDVWVTVFTLHIMGALANAGPYVEFSIEGPDYYPWEQGLLRNPPRARDGKVAIPDGPGWGVEIEPSWLDKAAYQVTEIGA
ncbi:MAG: mandelate racemase/muconate lactonizing enzyme family protein [Hyphomicrobiales bacterium]|nr:MAG: mandelate racemase/muconate lactonizing enzyme family protein [Hyphomicrobiales bacterium]